MSKKYTVTYQVQYNCTVQVDDDETLDDVLSNIHIPEGGSNFPMDRQGSMYVEDSLKVLSVYDDEGLCEVWENNEE